MSSPLVIIAGGKGTRLGLKDIPKPMIKVAGKPILEHQILMARKFGIKKIFILIGYLGEKIQAYIGDGSRYDVVISYIKESMPLGTAGAVAQLKEYMSTDFIVFYGDTIMDINIDSFIRFHHSKGKPVASILVHPNDHPYDSDLLEIDYVTKKVKYFYPKPHPENFTYFNLVNAALYIFSPEIFDYINPDENKDFGKDIFPNLLKAGIPIYGYKTSEYIKDMGTPERLKKVSSHLLQGKVSRLSKNQKQKAIFLDRDGVINQDKEGCITSVDEFVLLDGVVQAIKKINQSNYLSIVITNQPAIAKGFMTIETLNNIHKKMETILGKNGTYINNLYFCPHHPEKGFDGEIKELKVECNCRKPNIGLFLEAVNDYNIDVKKSYMIGDRDTDIEAGEKMGLRTIKITNQQDAVKSYPKPDFLIGTLLEAIEMIEKNDCN